MLDICLLYVIVHDDTFSLVTYVCNTIIILLLTFVSFYSPF
ncbi:unnamed protein product [Brassica rapa subsp. narinosa]